MKPTSTTVAISAIAALVAGAFMLLVPGCGDSVPALSTGTAGATGTAGSTGAGGAGGLTGGGGNVSVGTAKCSDGIDNDGDGKIDYGDPECVGPLDDDESTFATGIPGDNSDACKQDCFFDGNSGMGDDHCLWQLKCDPAITSGECAYDQAYATSHASECSLASSQSQACIDNCRKLVPNGCDCFGCCTVPGATTPIRLAPTCTAADFNDPVKCPRCTQVTQCMVPCGTCEICVGKPTLPPECTPDGGTPYTCPAGVMACGQYGIDPALCPEGTACITGCCRIFIN